MTTEQKAKAYDEVREKIAIRFSSKVADEIFSEFEESEDEKIRKGLTEFLKSASGGFLDTTTQCKTFGKWVAWLEKQGEKTQQTPQWMIDFLDDNRSKFASLMEDYDEQREAEGKLLAIIAWLEKQGKKETLCDKCRKEHPSHSCQDITALGRCALENQDEQKKSYDVCDSSMMDNKKSPYGEKRDFGYFEEKPADKVEPKFKVGNWYQCTKDFFGKGVTFDKNTAYYCAKEGCLLDGCHIAIVKDLYDNFKLWTIQDAKDGDVLACENGWTCIFKCLNDNLFSSYCFIGNEGWFCGDEGQVHMLDTIICGEIYPATKEQRDLLFQKMKEAGYEWDDEKKELKKIEQKSQRMVSAEAKEALYDKPTDEEMKELLRTEYEKGRADVLRCIDPDVMVADFCSQPLSKTRSIASIYRQGIIDILKRINRNEETSITGTRSIDDCGL